MTNIYEIKLPRKLLNAIKREVNYSTVETGGLINIAANGLIEEVVKLRGKKASIDLAPRKTDEIMWHIHEKSLGTDTDNPPSLADYIAFLELPCQYSIIFAWNVIYVQSKLDESKSNLDNAKRLASKIRKGQRSGNTPMLKYLAKKIRGSEKEYIKILKPMYRQTIIDIMDEMFRVQTDIIPYGSDIILEVTPVD